MLDRQTARVPRVAMHYINSSTPWAEVDYEEFLTRVKWMKLDPAEESTRLVNGEEIRLAYMVFRLAELAPIPPAAPEPESDGPAGEAEEQNHQQISLF